MTETELQSLRDWAARKMGWSIESFPLDWWGNQPPYEDSYGERLELDGVFKVVMRKLDWQPDNPDTGQIWRFVERMRELGWYLTLKGKPDGDVNIARFSTYNDKREVINIMKWVNHPNPCLAILKAARATEEG